MPVKSRFTRLDAFTKTVEDARVRTTSGGIVTIASLLVLFWLVWGEWAEYKRVLVRPELVVDKGRGTCLFLRGNWLDMNPFFSRLLFLDVVVYALTQDQEREWTYT